MSTTGTSTRHAQVRYDGYCAFWQKSEQLLRRLDWLHVLDYVDVRDTEQMKSIAVPVEADKVLEEMHVVTRDSRQPYHGFGAVRWLAWRLPLLWPVAPFLYIPGIPALGQRLYLWVARHRFQLVPCHGGVCTLPGHAPVGTKEADQRQT